MMIILYLLLAQMEVGRGIKSYMMQLIILTQELT